MRILIRLGAFLLVLLAAALPAAAQPAPTVLYLDSQPGDYIGQGLEQMLTESDLTFSASVSTDRSRVTISTSGPDSTYRWELNFAAPQGTLLAPGNYDPALNYPFHPAHTPGLRVS